MAGLASMSDCPMTRTVLRTAGGLEPDLFGGAAAMATDNLVARRSRNAPFPAVSVWEFAEKLHPGDLARRITQIFSEVVLPPPANQNR